MPYSDEDENEVPCACTVCFWKEKRPLQAHNRPPVHLVLAVEAQNCRIQAGELQNSGNTDGRRVVVDWIHVSQHSTLASLLETNHAADTARNDMAIMSPKHFQLITFSSAGRAVHINWSKCCLCVCVWVLTKVTQIITAAHWLVILHAQTY